MKPRMVQLVGIIGIFTFGVLLAILIGGASPPPVNPLGPFMRYTPGQPEPEVSIFCDAPYYVEDYARYTGKNVSFGACRFPVFFIVHRIDYQITYKKITYASFAMNSVSEISWGQAALMYPGTKVRWYRWAVSVHNSYLFFYVRRGAFSWFAPVERLTFWQLANS